MSVPVIEWTDIFEGYCETFFAHHAYRYSCAYAGSSLSQFNKQIKRAEGQKPPKVELSVSVDGVTVQEPKYKVSHGAEPKYNVTLLCLLEWVRQRAVWLRIETRDVLLMRR